jgi:hypothetical protein
MSCKTGHLKNTTNMKNVFFLSMTLIFCLYSCEKEPFESAGNIKVDSVFANELKSLPESITIGSNTIILSTYLWRDYMPISEENGSKMNCVNKLTEIKEQPILSTISLKKQYIVKDNEVWTAEYTQIKHAPTYIIEGYINGGPKWGPNIKVDVICEFEYLGVIYRILAKSQYISKTE